MLHHVKKLFGIKPKVEAAPEVPYKVETPAPTVADTAVEAMVTSLVVEGAGAVDVPAAKKKPAAKKAPAVKKPRTPRKPKAE